MDSDQGRTAADGAQHQGAAPYEPPVLSSYGTIEEWTKGRSQLIQISVII